MRHHDAIAARGIPVAWRPPFAAGAPAWCERVPAGTSILQIVLSVPELPGDFLARGVVCVNGEEVPRPLWAQVRLKPMRAELPVAVTLHWPARGGGGGGGGNSTAKSVGALVAALALTVVTAGIGGGFLAPVLGSSFAAGSFGASALAAGVGLAGALAISALTPPPSLAAIGPAQAAGAIGAGISEQTSAAGASGNVLAPGGAIPRVIGTRKVFFPLAGEPIVELVGDDEFVEAAFIGNGPHALEDPRIDGVGIADAEDVDYEIREGWVDDAPLTLATRQGRTLTPQLTLSTHKVDSDNQSQLAHQSDPQSDLPVFHPVATRDSPDEVWLHLLLPNGISVNGSTATDVVVPLRLRLRRRGDSSWINLPEIHLSDSTLQQRRRAVLLKFSTPPYVSSVVPPQESGFSYAHVAVPGQTAAPATDGWDADGYFIGASGADYLNAAVAGGSKVANVALYDNRVEIFLDPASFDPGIYEIEIKRGAAFLASSFTPSSYSYSGAVKDFFTYSGTAPAAIPMARTNLADAIGLARVVSIWNRPLIGKPGLAVLAVRARNRQVQQVSVTASGYVRDWDGSGWNSWTTTSNPAPHYVDILSGAQNIDPLPADLRDDAGLVAWRALCADNGWACDAVIDDFRTQDALTLLASCGYARPYQSEIYGVTVDGDRSADDPIQVFSRRNARNVRFERAFARVPDGFIVNYADKAADYDGAQVTVYQRDRSLATSGLLETVTYDGLVDAAAVIARAQFDLDQANQRATFYYLDSDIESILCRRGDLVALQHDILTARCGDGLIKRKIVSGGDITGLLLDAKIPITNEPDMHAATDMHGVADMHQVGVVTGIAVRHSDGTLSTHELADATGETDSVTLATPFADDAAIEALEDSDGEYGSLVVAGALASEYLRVLVHGVTPTKDLQASLALVDEAPDLVRYAA